MSKKILLIDSDEAFAQTLSHAIASRGFAPTLATNSEQGMSMAKQESPDLIVVCVEAQPTNGYMLCTRLKKDDQLKGIPVILTSANATVDSFEKHKKLKTRAEEYLIKPFEPIVMLEKASQLLGIQLPAEMAQDEEIVSMDDEPLGLGDLVPGEDEPISLSEADVAEAHGGVAEEPLVVEEVEEVQELSEEPAQGDDDLEMFDKAFDSLEAPSAPAAGEDDTRRFGDLSVVPDEAPAEASQETLDLLEDAHVPPTDLSAPDDSDVLHGLEEQPSMESAAVSADDEVRAHLEGRVAELEHALAERDAELVQAKKGAGSTSSAELLKLKEAKNRNDKEVLRLKEELNAKDKELVEIQERETALEGQAQQLKDDAAKREAAAKALQQRADALAAAAKKFERELLAAREEAKKAAIAQGKAAELSAAHDELRKKHETVSSEAKKQQERAGQLETELAGAREMHADELATAQSAASKVSEELDKHKSDLGAARGEAEKHKADLAAAQSAHDDTRTELEGAHHESEGLRTELETLRTDATALTGEKDLISEERDELKKQLEEAQAQAATNEDRAVKAYQKIKNDEKLREKTRKALQIALQLLEDDAEDADVTAEKKSA
ncbi:MAG TPA: response regulator [Myxococcales bacterium]|nr:response regulator [Myxococcales bacterium]